MKANKKITEKDALKKSRAPQFLEFLSRVANEAGSSNIDHYFRSGSIENDTSLRTLGSSFLTLAMGFEEDEFLVYAGGNESPTFVPQSKDYYPWALFVVPTAQTDLMEVFHKQALQYLLSDSALQKKHVVITNLKSLIALIPHFGGVSFFSPAVS
ncbi:MAG: hypothetical protein HYW48_08985 [Deltaproteobacteria bacterium]|nr:hypothetical protein [Deltaproteobacteria bacterium]